MEALCTGGSPIIVSVAPVTRNRISATSQFLERYRAGVPPKSIPCYKPSTREEFDMRGPPAPSHALVHRMPRSVPAWLSKVSQYLIVRLSETQ